MKNRDQHSIRLLAQRRLIDSVVGLCAALCLSVSGTAAADVTLTYAESNSGAQAFEINIQPPMIRMNEAGGMWMLYDGRLDTMFAVDPGNKKYTRINRDRAALMGGMMNEAQAQMQEMMKNMTPEQRAMMEQAMGSKMPTAAPESTFRKTGKSRKVSGKNCQEGQLLVEGKVEHEFCIAAPKEVGVGDNEYKVMTQMFDLMSALREAAGSYFGRNIPDPKDMQGVAIESRASSGEHHVLKDVSQKKLDAALFKLPSDYQEEAIPRLP